MAPSYFGFSHSPLLRGTQNCEKEEDTPPSSTFTFRFSGTSSMMFESAQRVEDSNSLVSIPTREEKRKRRTMSPEALKERELLLSQKRKLRVFLREAKEKKDTGKTENLQKKLRILKRYHLDKLKRSLHQKEKTLKRHDQANWQIKRVPMVIWPIKKSARGNYRYISKKHTNAKRIHYNSRYIP